MRIIGGVHTLTDLEVIVKIRTPLLPALALALSLAAPAPAWAANDRMELYCHEGTLEGHTLERTNGSSWWDTVDGTTYTTKTLLVTGQDGTIVHEKGYGAEARSEKRSEAESCTADHFGFTWEIEVVRAGRD